jgi:hypothetical protein
VQGGGEHEAADAVQREVERSAVLTDLSDHGVDAELAHLLDA